MRTHRDALVRIANRFSGGFILVFHEIRAESFARFIDSLDGFRPIHLGELIERARRGKSNANLFAITVDDGIGDTVRGVSAMMIANSWPGTFYVPTGYLDSRVGMPFQWWYKLEPFIQGQVIPLEEEILDLRPPGAVRKLWRRMEVLWRTQPPDTYVPLIQQLVEFAKRSGLATPEELEPAVPISWQEVRELSRSGWVRFESHGISHVAVSALTQKQLQHEMEESRCRIEEHTGEPCRHFCYPFGSTEAIGPLAPTVARRYFDSAVTMSMGPVEDADPWLLPRIPFYEKNSLTVAHLKIVLKCTPVRSVFRYRS